YPEHSGKAKPSSFARFFGGEEWIVNLLDDSGRNAQSGIANPERDVSAGFRIRRHGSVAFIDLHVVRPNHERAAIRHGIARVHAQIHQHLVELSRISENAPKVFRITAADFDR